jgi:hypothetical protein
MWYIIINILSSIEIFGTSAIYCFLLRLRLLEDEIIHSRLQEHRLMLVNLSGGFSVAPTKNDLQGRRHFVDRRGRTEIVTGAVQG